MNVRSSTLMLDGLVRRASEVTEATGGAEALQRMENHQFDLMLCDLSMPQVDALSLLKRLRARSPEVPVVLMLDPRDSLTAIEAAPLGAFKCLVKPIAPKALEEAAANAVRLHRSGRRTLAVFHNLRVLAEEKEQSLRVDTGLASARGATLRWFAWA